MSDIQTKQTLNKTPGTQSILSKNQEEVVMDEGVTFSQPPKVHARADTANDCARRVKDL